MLRHIHMHDGDYPVWNPRSLNRKKQEKIAKILKFKVKEFKKGRKRNGQER